MLQPTVRTMLKKKSMNMSVLAKIKMIIRHVRATYKPEKKINDDIALYILCHLPNVGGKRKNDAQIK